MRNMARGEGTIVVRTGKADDSHQGVPAYIFLSSIIFLLKGSPE